VQEFTIRPTAKFLKAGTILAAVVFLALEILYFVYLQDKATPILLVLPPLILIWPGVRWLRRRYTMAVVTGDRLRYESGLASKSTRTIQLSKLQDVRVDQRLMQRLFGIGDISLETSGETSRLTIRNIDHPQATADDLMNRSQDGAAANRGI
jgi:putative membrane protein